MALGKEALVKELLVAAEAYYQDTVPTMTDHEYDTKIALLRVCATEDDLANNTDIINLLEGDVAGGSTPSGILVNHGVPMLSLKKAKTIEELRSFYGKLTTAGAQGFRVQSKLDGLAVSAIYRKGLLIELSTRGDGYVGEDLSYLIDHKEVTICNMPTKLEINMDLEARGELFARFSQYDVFNKRRTAMTGESFRNSRNATVGVVKKAAGGLGYSAELTFSPYSIYVDGQLADMKLLQKAGFKSVNDLTIEEYRNASGTGKLSCGLDIDKLIDIVKDFGEKRVDFDIPTDGCVIKPFGETELSSQMGYTSHHPVAFIAYKYPSEKEVTTVTDLVITVGKTGKLTPNARITPTTVGGTTIRRASLHNFAWITQRDIRIGSTVTVTRANDVIPQIADVIDSGDGAKIEVPTVCPECKKPLYADGEIYKKGDPIPKTLACKNPSCPSRLEFQLKSIVARNGLDIDGLSEVGITALCETGTIKTVGDLFFITEEQLASLPTGETSIGNVRTFGPGNAKKVIAAIEQAKASTPAHKMLYCLGIDRLGPSYSKSLIEKFGNIESALKAEYADFEGLAGWGEVRIESFIEQAPRALLLWNRMRKAGFSEPIEEKKAIQTLGTFSISGDVPEGYKNRDEYVAAMEELGWEYHKSHKKDTNYLIADPNGTSKKVLAAKKNGTKIVSQLP